MKSCSSSQKNRKICPRLSAKRNISLVIAIVTFCFLSCLILSSENTFAQVVSGGSVNRSSSTSSPNGAALTKFSGSSKGGSAATPAGGSGGTVTAPASSRPPAATTGVVPAGNGVGSVAQGAKQGITGTGAVGQTVGGFGSPAAAARMPGSTVTPPMSTTSPTSQPGSFKTATSNPFPMQQPYNGFENIGQYTPARSTAIQPYKLPVINTSGTLKPISPVFIQPYKMTALNSGLPNNYTALKPMQPGFVKMEQILPKLTQPALLKPQSIKFSAITPLNMPLDTKLTKITQIPITIPKLTPAFNTVKPLAFTKITQPEPIKITLGQLNPALNYSLKPVFNPIKPVTPTILAIDPKLTKMPTSVIMPLPKLNTPSFNSLNKQAFMPIRQPEPIKAALGKLNPYFIKEQSMLSPIKPNFMPIAQNLTAMKPEIIKINQFNQPIKPEFTKIGQLSPTIMSLVPIKPNLISIDGIKPLNISLDKNITKIPVIATPKFIPADFSAVMKPVLPVMKQPEPIKAVLGKLNPVFNNELKPAFSPIKNPITAPIAQPAAIKPQWIETSQFVKPIKVEPNKIGQVTPNLVQAVPIKPDLETISMPKQAPLAIPLIEKPEITAIKELPIPKANLNNSPIAFEKIKPQEIAFLEFQKLVLTAPAKINPVVQKADFIQATIIEKIKEPAQPVMVKLPETMPKVLENPVSDTAKILINENKTISPAVNVNTFDIAKNNMIQKQQLDALKPKPISLVDNYMQQLKTVYEWQKINKELAYLSRNAEVISENEAPVELAGLNEKIAKAKAELDKKSPEVKDIFAKKLVEPSVLVNNEKSINLTTFPVKEVPVKEVPVNELPQGLPVEPNLPLNPPVLLPETMPKAEGGFIPGLRAMFKSNVFAGTSNRYAELIDSDLENIARLRNK